MLKRFVQTRVRLRMFDLVVLTLIACLAMVVFAQWHDYHATLSPGTPNTVAKFSSASTVGDSASTDDGTTFAINTNKFTVTEASGNTQVAGTLGSTGAFTGTTTGSFGGTLNMNSHTITNVTNGSSAQDAAAFGQISSAVTSAVSGTTNTTTKFTGTNAVGNAWPTDDATTWGVTSKFTITEASGNFRSFGTGTIDGAFVGSSTGSFGGALNMNSHQINNVTAPSVGTDAATKTYVDTAITTTTGTSLSSFVFDGGFDSTCNFDGVTTPVCGATLSGAIYTMARPVYATNSTISTGVEVKENGYPFFANGTLTLTGTGKLTCSGGNGGNGAGGVAAGGARPITAASFYTNAQYLGGAAGNGNATATTHTFPAPVGTAAAAVTGGALTSNGGPGSVRFQGASGGGAGTGGQVGGNSGAIVLATQGDFGGYSGFATQPRLISGTQFDYGTGGGGGGANVSGNTGGGGGGPGGFLFVAARIITGSGTIEAKGGNGGTGETAAGANPGTGGGGGGGGGLIIVVFQTNSGTVAASVTGGSGGNKGAVGTGSLGGNGGTGANGLLVSYNLSGDGTHL